MNLDGSDVKQLIDIEGPPVWAPDADKIAFGVNGIYMLTPGAPDSGFRYLNTGARACCATWSPDGQKIAFEDEDGYGIYTVDPWGENITRLTPSCGANGCGEYEVLDWSPDGQAILFAFAPAGGAGHIYTMNPTGGNVTQTALPVVQGRYSPDGTRIGYTFPSGPGSTREIYTVKLDGTDVRRLTNNSVDDVFGGWSPDGTKIVFSRFQPDLGMNDIYTMNVDGTGQVSIRHGGFAPDWGRAVHDHPQTAPSISEALVPSFRQTISSTQCQARGGSPSTHGAPLALSSCNPPGYLPNTQARLGPQSTGSVQLSAVPGDPLTAADEADLALAVNATDVQSRQSGDDYDPNPSGPDVTIAPLLRLSDTYNGAFLTASATTSDFTLSFPVSCAPTADPATGSTCSATTSADSVTPGSVREGKKTVLSANKLWLYDSGVDAVRGNGDDRQFAQSGIYVP